MAGLGGGGGGSGAEALWSAATLVNSWADYDAATYGVAGYRKGANGQVYMRGMVGGGSPDVGASGVICTLPAGYRPSKARVIPSIGFGGGVYLKIQTNGDVHYEVGNGTWVSLDGVDFDTQ